MLRVLRGVRSLRASFTSLFDAARPRKGRRKGRDRAARNDRDLTYNVPDSPRARSNRIAETGRASRALVRRRDRSCRYAWNLLFGTHLPGKCFVRASDRHKEKRESRVLPAAGQTYRCVDRDDSMSRIESTKDGTCRDLGDFACLLRTCPKRPSLFGTLM